MFNPFAAARQFFQRNFAVSNLWIVKMGQPQFSTWTVEKAVKSGYVASGWVYRAVFLLQQAASSAPMVVYNQEGEIEYDHPLTKVMKMPHPYISRKEVWKLITAWMYLAGQAYFKKVKVGGRLEELWPLSPDRIAPVPSKNIDEWIQGYAVDRKNKVEFEPDDVIHLKFTDPSNPLVGISPLQAASRAVDVDVDQQGWNKSAMQNRGVVDGVFSFDEKFSSQDEADTVSEKLNERYAGKSNARRVGVVGGGAKYHRTGLTAVEMDYMNSRKFNREEIFIIFGVPPQYAGAMEKSTYNNYQTSEMVFWFGTVIPFLMDIGSQLTFSLREELDEGYSILPDLTDVPAVRKAMADRAATAEKFFKMGVPFSNINKTFKLGFEEYEGWDISHVGGNADPAAEATSSSAGSTGSGGEGRSAVSLLSPPSPLISIEGLTVDLKDGSIRSGFIRQLIEAKRPVEGRGRYTLVETRADADSLAEQREAIAKSDFAPGMLGIFQRQMEEILKDVEEQRGTNVSVILSGYREEMEEYIGETYRKWAVEFGRDVVLQRAEITDDLEETIGQFLDDEQVTFEEVAAINKTTGSLVLDQVNEALNEGWSAGELQQAIIDVGIFDEARALRIGRTVLGTASSVGQLQAAMLSGATHKTWLTSKFEVRPEHVEREGEEVAITATFSPKFGMSFGPRFPLDNKIVPADRVNCRCSMSFAIKD